MLEGHYYSKALFILIITLLILIVFIYYPKNVSLSNQNSHLSRHHHLNIHKPNSNETKLNSISLQKTSLSVLSSIEFINSPFLELECDLSNIIPIIVLSKASNIEMRDAVRRTWAFEQSYQNNKIQIKVFFLVGIDDFMIRRIGTEQNLFSDVIQVSLSDMDSFSSYKELSAMLWVRTYLPKSPFYIKTEDHVIINMKNMIDILLPIIIPIKNENLVIGWFGSEHSVQRGTYQKFINAVIPPLFVDLYYAMSLLYVVTSTASDRMLDALSHVEVIEHPGDPFVTGILRESAHVQIKNLAESMNKYTYEISDGTCIEPFKEKSNLLFCTSSLHVATNRAIPEFFDAWHLLNNQH